MKKHIPLAIAALLTFSLLQAKAQIDTTKYDLGRIPVKKNFTQAITIKAADLEKIPFITLSDAVRNWLYGIYGANLNYTTVIDGLLNADVNAYSIYDIEEITLVQNALVQLNGISPSQMLLLVKTKRGHAGKSGVTIAGQTNLINLRNTNTLSTDNAKSTNSFYHQYYASVYANTAATQTGFSADWQHYAVPQLKTAVTNLGAPINLNRIKLNGYLDTKLDNNNSLSLNAGFVPQKVTDDYTYITTSSLTQYHSSGKENLLHADVKLQSHSAGLHNELSAGIQHYSLSSSILGAVATINPVGSNTSNYSRDTASHVTAFIIKDDISYPVKSGKWEIEPNLNFTYSHFKNDINNNYTVNSGGYTSQGTSSAGLVQTLTLLTPSVSFNYGNAFLVQGGAQISLNSSAAISITANPLKQPAKAYPFVSATVNLLQLNGQEASDTQLKVYGSLSRSLVYMSAYISQLTDGGTSGLPAYTAYGYGLNGSLVYSDPQYNQYKAYTQVQAGTTLSLLKNKLNISYNYNNRRDNVLFVGLVPTPGNGTAYYYYHPDNHVNLHRVSVDMNLIGSDNFKWTPGINMSIIKTKLDVPANTFNATFADYYNTRVITGGFINRLAYKKVFAGVDMLYRLNEPIYPLGIGNAAAHINSLVLQNLYAGYSLPLKGTKGLEVFASTRNLVQNAKSDITDNRKFYGLGFKVAL